MQTKINNIHLYGDVTAGSTTVNDAAFENLLNGGFLRGVSTLGEWCGYFQSSTVTDTIPANTQSSTFELVSTTPVTRNYNYTGSAITDISATERQTMLLYFNGMPAGEEITIQAVYLLDSLVVSQTTTKYTAADTGLHLIGIGLQNNLATTDQALTGKTLTMRLTLAKTTTGSVSINLISTPTYPSKLFRNKQTAGFNQIVGIFNGSLMTAEQVHGYLLNRSVDVDNITIKENEDGDIYVDKAGLALEWTDLGDTPVYDGSKSGKFLRVTETGSGLEWADALHETGAVGQRLITNADLTDGAIVWSFADLEITGRTNVVVIDQTGTVVTESAGIIIQWQASSLRIDLSLLGAITGSWMVLYGAGVQTAQGGYTVITTTGNIVANDNDWIICLATVTVTLPASGKVKITSTNGNVTVTGGTIESLAEDLIIDSNNAWCELVYTTDTWRVAAFNVPAMSTQTNQSITIPITSANTTGTDYAITWDGLSATITHPLNGRCISAVYGGDEIQRYLPVKYINAATISITFETGDVPASTPWHVMLFKPL